MSDDDQNELLGRARAYVRLAFAGASRSAESVSDDDALYAYEKQLAKLSPSFAAHVGTVMDDMAADASLLQRAEAFADRMEAYLRDLGVTGDHFTQDEKARWRQGSLRAYLGLSPGPNEQAESGPWIPEFPAAGPAGR